MEIHLQEFRESTIKFLCIYYLYVRYDCTLLNYYYYYYY
jgi:hypothetical protein